MWRQQGERGGETHAPRRVATLLARAIRSPRKLLLSAGLPRPPMCGRVGVRETGGVRQEVQQQRGECGRQLCLLRRATGDSMFEWRLFCVGIPQVCNHKKECHCDPGWAPPHCDIQYADLPQGTGRSSLDHRHTHTHRNHSSSDSLRAVPSVCPPEN